MNETLCIGLMSGTSVDAVDAALLRSGDKGPMELLAHRAHPIPSAMRRRIAAICQSGPDEIERLGVLDREIGALFAQAALELLAESGREPGDIAVIGSHGQTVRHRPPSGGSGTSVSFSLQIGDPNTIVELTGITTVADFRRRDLAAGGEGAPLAPAFHAAAFSREQVNRAVVNIGGIANATVLRGTELVAGFDTGPGNTLLDQWIERFKGEPFDRDGAWAASGRVNPSLLEELLRHPYLDAGGPRSTGREDFNLIWLDRMLGSRPGLNPRDVMTTLTEFTAATITTALQREEVDIDEVYLCGGGSHNGFLRQRLAAHLQLQKLEDTGVLGIDPDWVEAAAFAWLAERTLKGLPGNAPAVTGAAGPRVLGAVYRP